MTHTNDSSCYKTRTDKTMSKSSEHSNISAEAMIGMHNRTRNLPRVLNLRNIQSLTTNLLNHLQHRVQRPQPLRQLNRLRSQDVVLGLHLDVPPRRRVNLLGDLGVIVLENGNLVDEIAELLLLPHP